MLGKVVVECIIEDNRNICTKKHNIVSPTICTDQATKDIKPRELKATIAIIIDAA